MRTWRRSSRCSVAPSTTTRCRASCSRPRQPHWYLATLGTAPERQGRGVGSTLLATVLDRLDEEGLPAYLESSKERNVAFYARHRFEVVRELVVPHGGPRLWLMWREPR